MEAARGFGGLFLAAAARASGGAASLGRVEAASKLGMGAARCGHPVFMARSSLGRKAREEVRRVWTSGGGGVRRGNESEEGEGG